MPGNSTDLVLFNARVLTLQERQPFGELVAVQGGRIAHVGSNEDLAALRGPGTQLVDCDGRTLLPGFIDAHCHLFAYAASLLAVDCSPAAVDSIPALKSAVMRRSAGTPPGRWIKAAGYDEFHLAERRHPTRWDLDDAAPRHPVALTHRSGHATVLNSMALERVGISAGTDEPPGATIDRNLDTGEPSGLLIDMGRFLQDRIPRLSGAELRRAVRLANSSFLSYGVTAVQDATLSNSIARWDDFCELVPEGLLVVRVTVMPGIDHVDAFAERGLEFGAGGPSLRVGHAKITLTLSTGALTPGRETLADQVATAHELGFPVAVHAVEREAVEAAAGAIEAARREGLRDRIEHCSECPPATLDLLRRSGASVVTQPAFIFHSGERYLAEVPGDLQPWLYRTRSLMDAGVVTAASSDAPVIPPRPVLGMYSAVTRRAATGDTLGAWEAITAGDALKMYGPNAAFVTGQEGSLGTIERGKLADLVALDVDPTQVRPERLLDARPTMTIVAGRIAWRR